MLLCVSDILPAEELTAVREKLSGVAFVDGRETAQGRAKDIKHNLQAPLGDDTLKPVREQVVARLMRHELVQISCYPKLVSMLLFSRYEPGMHYGSHVDSPLMAGLRSDISFTLFLSDPADYDGGELIIESTAGEQPVKLRAGAAVLYPSTTLHRVNKVTRGARLAAVGWMRSYVRDPAQRELLFDLETVRRSIRKREDAQAESNLLMKSASNLLRMWSDD